MGLTLEPIAKDNFVGGASMHTVLPICRRYVSSKRGCSDLRHIGVQLDHLLILDVLANFLLMQTDCTDSITWHSYDGEETLILSQRYKL